MFDDDDSVGTKIMKVMIFVITVMIIIMILL